MLRFNANKQSTLLSNRPSQISAGTPNNVANEGGELRVMSGTVALVATDLTANDTVMLCGLPTGAAVHQIWIANDDLEGATPTMTGDIGLWADADGVTVKDEDVYAAASTQFQGASAFVDHAFTTRGIELAGQKVWEDAGDTEDPNGEYFLGIKFESTGANPQAGDVSFIVVYSVT